jgi:lipopolysaccharide/colanic/teichoic acid biosynthesis glycosyltransferase
VTRPLSRSRPQRAAKRAIDVVVALGVLGGLGPLMVLLAVACRVSTGQSGVFSQARVGRNGKVFLVRKLRTMRTSGASTATYAGDPRITRLGAVLRRAKLDELPQAWNVLVGDMSLIGPRPDVPGFADQLVGDDRLLLEMRPGISGPATLLLREEETLLAQVRDPEAHTREVLWPFKVRVNLAYWRHATVLDDLRMILLTVREDSFRLNGMVQSWGVTDSEISSVVKH